MAIRIRQSIWILSTLLLVSAGSVVAAPRPLVPALSIVPITWDVVGLDSNNVNQGPNTFLVGARVTNTGDTTADDVVATFTWDSANAAIALNVANTQTLPSLAAGASADFYFEIVVTRAAASYDATRQYHITASADGVAGVDTPAGRQIYVEHLVSQNRNAIFTITGPTSVQVGDTATYTMTCKTATGGYEELDTFLTLPSSIFRVISIAAVYNVPTGATNDKMWADAGGWDSDPASPTYRSVIGPENYAGGNAGGNPISISATVQLVGTGTATVTAGIYDFSGSSYHYNSDYGGISITVTSSPPANDAPVNTVPGAQSVAEDSSLTLTGATAISISDTDAGSASVQVTLTATDGALTLSGTSGLTFTAGDGTADASMTFTGTIANINTALDGMTYTPTAEFNGSASVTILTDDLGNSGSGGAQMDSDSIAITVTAVNDGPANTVPGAQTTTEDVPVTFTGATAVSISDIDAASSSVQVTLTATNGTVTLSGTIGLTFTTGDGTADASMTFTGTVAAINTALDGMAFLPGPSFAGSASFTIVTDDQGNTGSGGALTDTDSVDITVTATDDPPFAVPDVYTVPAGSELFIGGIGVVLNDIDIDSPTLTAILVTGVSHGTLTLNPDGTFFYNPWGNFYGTDSFTYAVTDGTSISNMVTVTIDVGATALIVDVPGALPGVHGVDPPYALSGGTEGAFYWQQLVATGGVGGYRWELDSASPSFPFNLDGETGVISGTAPAGTYSFRIKLTDSQNPADEDVRDFTITIGAPDASPPDISVSPLPPRGHLDQAYEFFFTATHGTPGYEWSVVAGALPAGLALDPFTGRLAGTPTVAGTYTFTLRTTDAVGGFDDQAFTIIVDPDPIYIITTFVADGCIGSAYQQPIDTWGGRGPTFSWSVAAGSLPPGLSLAGTGRTAYLQGTPTAAGTYSFTVQADDDGQAGVSDTQDLTVTIAVAGALPIAITTTELPSGTSGEGYSATLTSVGGTGPFTWSLPGGSLPAGLSLDPSTGAITGTPTQSGEFVVRAQVTDSNGVSSEKEFVLVVGAPPVILTASSLPEAWRLQGYSTELEGAGGVGPYSWSVVGGTLGADGQWTGGGIPAGVGLSIDTGTLTGTPSAAAGSYSFDVILTDSNGATFTRTFTVVVNDDPGATLTVLTDHLPIGWVGNPYSAQIIATGGTQPYSWSEITGNLPTWATLDPVTGALSGVPDAPGTWTLRFRVTDAIAGTDDSVQITLTVLDAPEITTTSIPDGVLGNAYSMPLDSVGGVGPYQWSVAGGTLPAGLCLDGETGVISGIPLYDDVWTFNVQILDANGQIAFKQFIFRVTALGSVVGGKWPAGYCHASASSTAGSPLLLVVPLLILIASAIRWRTLLTLAVLLLAAATAVAQEEPNPPERNPFSWGFSEEREGPSFLRLEAGPRAGITFYSYKFEADPAPLYGLSFRATFPWLGTALEEQHPPEDNPFSWGFTLEPPRDRFGLFLDLMATTINRDIDSLDHKSGELFFAGAGADFAFLQGAKWSVRAQAGLQLGEMGGVSQLQSGVAAIIGLAGSLRLGSLILELNPQMTVADVGNRIAFVQAGFSYGF